MLFTRIQVSAVVIIITPHPHFHPLSSLHTRLAVTRMPRCRTPSRLAEFNRFFENQPNEICGQKAGFLRPRSSKITVTKEKERRKRKREERERRRRAKSMAALVVFIIATLEIIFGRETQLDETGPFGDNVFKNPARCKRTTIVAETGFELSHQTISVFC